MSVLDDVRDAAASQLKRGDRDDTRIAPPSWRILLGKKSKGVVQMALAMPAGDAGKEDLYAALVEVAGVAVAWAGRLAPSSEPAALPCFRGDLAWIHQWEGHAGHPYWPGENSGVTLDPGADLGHCNASLLRNYEAILSPEQYAVIVGVHSEGLLGEDAGFAVDTRAGRQALRSIRITREQAAKLFPLIASPYWSAIVERFPELVDDRTPPEVQTALLSLAYNRGAGNKGLRVLAVPLSGGDWTHVGDLIKQMQQDHALEGIQKRRRAEGDLILNRQGTAD